MFLVKMIIVGKRLKFCMHANGQQVEMHDSLKTYFILRILAMYMYTIICVYVLNTIRNEFYCVMDYP